MKLGNLIIGAALLFSANTFAQEDAERECLRMRFLAGEELKINNYATASSYYLKGEVICGGYEKSNYDRLIGCLRNTLSTATEKGAYIDTLLAVYNRADAAKHLDPTSALVRASYELQAATPNRQKADSLLKVGISKEGDKVDGGYVSYYYYNIYMMHSTAPNATKHALKKRLIEEYFQLSNLVARANMPVGIQNNLTTYFNTVINSCSDILPELNGFMYSLPSDLELKKTAVNNFIKLLEDKKCDESKEYEMLIDTLISIDPSIDAIIAKAKLLRSKKRYSEAITTLKDAKEMAGAGDKSEEIEYTIAEIQFNSGSYTSAHNTALGISGKYRGEALKIAAQCVAQTSNNCGSGTIDRKMNYYYAVDLLERAQSAGASVGVLISSYKGRFPTDGEIFESEYKKGQSVNLSCWGVSVSIR
jgi:hypothetical protein